ncbi:MAG: DUF2892 domain-containing protein [Marinilabilia sp.]
MKKNVGIFDRTLRIVIAAILATLYFTGAVTGTAGTVMLIIAAIALVTGVLRLCGLYAIFGINSCRTKTEDQK